MFQILDGAVGGTNQAKKPLIQQRMRRKSTLGADEETLVFYFRRKGWRLRAFRELWEMLRGQFKGEIELMGFNDIKDKLIANSKLGEESFQSLVEIRFQLWGEEIRK